MTDDDPDARIRRLAARSAGEAGEDPYEGVDVDEFPEWWRRTIALFEDYGLRPYRPPRFEDGVLKHEVVEPLETELDVDVRFACLNPQDGDRWDVYVDGDRIGEIGHRRSPEGYSVYEMDSDEFEALVRDAVRE